MRAGELRHTITIYQKNVTGQDATGADVLGAPTVVATLRASIRALSGREMVALQQTFADARLEVKTRYTAGIDTALYIVDDLSRTLNILDAQDPDGRRRALVMICSQVT